MDIVTSILGLATSIFNRVVPDKSKEQEQQFVLELQKAIIESQLLKTQTDINQAEAANPNRKWITWRELTGYFCAFAVGYTYIAQPFLIFTFAAVGHPITYPLPDLDMGQLMFLLIGMLGLGGMSSLEKIKGIKK